MRKKSGIIISLLMLIMLLMASPAFANSTVEVDNIIVDKTAPAKPTITLSGTEASGGMCCRRSPLAAYRTAATPSGIKELEYSLDGVQLQLQCPAQALQEPVFFSNYCVRYLLDSSRLLTTPATSATSGTTLMSKGWYYSIFKQLYYSTYTAGEGGTIEGETVQTVGHGADGTPVKAVLIQDTTLWVG